MYPRQNVSDQCLSFPLLPDVVVEEFFEYDAEDFLVFLTLLITEGRTPECSVKGRTEGLHCPPAKSALPPLHRHECSDKLPQCVQARRVRSEVCVLWRNSIPIMVEVMLLPDCCYGDESPPSDPISDPAIKQDALLLERWTLQPVPRQSGDRFIEEKTLLLAVRSYVFFSQLSAWLSASHGIVPRNILYRISAADEECVCQFSQPPAEHLFPVPNVSQSVALRLRVQSLPRQPTYPTLACSIHTGLTLAPLYSKTPSLKPNLSPNLYSKTPSLNPGLNPNPPLYERSHDSKESHNRAALPFSGLPFPSPPSLPLPSKRGPDPTDSHGHSSQNGSDLPRVNKGQTSSPYHLPISPRPSPRPYRKLSSTLPLPPGGKTVRWLYSLTSDPSDDITHTTEDYGKAVNGAESSKGRGSEAPRAFKTYSLAEPPRCPSPRPSSETNPLIGSLLQERQEVIARIAQRLNFCDPTAPHLPPALFTPDTPTKTPVRSSYLGNTTLSKTKEPEEAPPTEDTPPSPFDTPIGDAAAIIRETLSPKPVACRRLRLPEDRDGERLRDRVRETLRDLETQRDREALRDRERDGSLLSHAVQDITRLIQDRLSVPSLSPTHSRSPLHKPHTHSTHTLCTDTHTTHRGGNSHSSGHCNGYTPSHDTHTPSHTPASTDRAGAPPETDGPIRAQNGCSTLEDPQVSPRLQILLQSSSLVIPRPLPQPQSSPLVIPRPLPQPQSQASPLLSPKSPRAKTPKSLHPNRPQEEPRPSSPKDNILRTIHTLTVTQTTTLTQTTAQTLTTKLTHTQTTALIQNHMKPLTQSHNQTQTVSRTPPSQTQGSPRTQSSSLQDENQPPPGSKSSSPPGPATTPPGTEPNTVLRSPSPLRPCNSRRKHNRHSLDSTLTKAFHPCTGLPLLSSPVPQRRTQTGYFDLDSSLTSCKGLPWTAGKRVCVKRVEESEEPQPLFSASAPPASLSLLGNFEECVLNYRLEPLGSVEGFMAEVGASGTFCPSHMTFPVDVSFYSISDDNAPSPYMGVINLETLGKRGYRVPPSGTIQVTLFNPNKTVVKMFVVVYDLRAMPAGHQTFLRQRTFSVPVRRDSTHSHKHGSPDNTHTPGSSRKALSLGQERILRYLIHLRFQTSRSGKVYLHRDIRLLFSRKSMEVDSGAAYELKSYTESPADPAFSPRC
ncbi:atos homolog protein A-like isoform X1 [Oncorhynchus clarkii lewisi]|uniref:atos homolog protein A-like isoform X1 n=1 Tax=Oncorhynchus clarkii lewisi TaxID=490388 RepID=UPI0039B883A4